MAQSWPLGIFPIVCDVMNSRLQRKLRVAKPEASATFSLYANGHGFPQWSISIPEVCFCRLSQMDTHSPPPPPPSTPPQRITCRLQALDIPGGSQEVASQKQEDSEERNNRNKDPGDDDSSYCDYSDHLKKYLGQMEKHRLLLTKDLQSHKLYYSYVGYRCSSEGQLFKLNKRDAISCVCARAPGTHGEV